VAWFKVDDGYHSSRKVLQIPRRHRWQAEGLWVHAGSWASDNLTDGHIPDYIIAEWGPPKSALDWLVKVGLWDRTHDGFDFRNWDEYQPSKAEVDALRVANRTRQKHFRDRLKHRKRLESAEAEGMSHVTNALVTEPRNGGVIPPRPDPTRPDHIKDFTSEATPRPDAEELCTLLADLVQGNGSKRPTITKAWLDAARLMLDRDGRELDKARNLIRWSQADGFWRKNILSMPKFRQRYDQLRLAALEDWEKNKTGSPSPDGEIDVNAILGKDVDGIGTPPEDIWGDEFAEHEWRQRRKAERKAERLAEAQQVLARRQGVMV
jgi:hypothetical protein